MQAWMEAEKSMSRPSCFLIRNQESSQMGKLEYFVPLQEGRFRVKISELADFYLASWRYAAKTPGR